jgi:hypothetical protein
MRELPVEIQQKIRDDFAVCQDIRLDYLRETYPQWQAEIEDWIIGFLINEADEIPDHLEDLVFEIMESDATPRRRESQTWSRAAKPRLN